MRNVDNLFDFTLDDFKYDKEVENYIYEFYVNKNSEYRDKVILKNLSLILYVINREFYYLDYDINDLFSVGEIYLIRCVDLFDISSGNTFSSYAYKCIKLGIRKYINSDIKHQTVDSIYDDYDLIDNYPSNINIEDEIINNDEIKKLYEKLELLPEKTQMIIKLYYGIGCDKHSFEEIGEILSCSRQNVCSILQNSKYKLKSKILSRV